MVSVLADKGFFPEYLLPVRLVKGIERHLQIHMLDTGLRVHEQDVAVVESRHVEQYDRARIDGR